MFLPDRTEPRIVLFDIETLANLKEVMKVMPSLSEYPGQTLKASINSIICFGYKIYGEKQTRCLNAWDYPNWKKDVNDDSALLKDIAEILGEADCFVTHNGKRFDLKFIQTRLLYHGMFPLSKKQHVDTCMESKRNLLLYNNRLNTLAKHMTSEEKLENGGWDLWCKVMERHAPSMKLMSEYCKQDVIVLEKVFKKLLPFVNNIPDFNMFSPIERDVCPNCGSTRFVFNGKRASKTKIYQRLRCMDCGTCSSKPSENKSPKTY